MSRDMTPSETNSDVKIQAGGSSRVDVEDIVPLSSRSRAMSWRQRPQSRDVDSFASTLKFPGDLPRRKTEEEESKKEESVSTMSRTQIAQALGSKDPSWFKQTSDRGIGSPACRKQPDASLSDSHLPGGTVKLPGMSKETSFDTEKKSAYDTERSRSPSRASSVHGAGNLGNRYSSISSVSTTGGLGSLIPLNAPRLESRASTNGDIQQADRVTMSPSQSRLASDRPVSPTKGLGGFVQSAMMKRSDSVSKRWSTQAGPVNFRHSFIAPRGDISPSRITLPSPGAQSPAIGQESISRPGSSHSEATVVRHPLDDLRSSITDSESVKEGTTPRNRFTRASFSSHSVSRSGSFSVADDLPTTPSKTMDPKRWSPTKASWLESALNKPESPKLKATRTPQEPEWKRDLTHKLRTSRDIGQSDKSPGFPSESRVRNENGNEGESEIPESSTEPNSPEVPQDKVERTNQELLAKEHSPAPPEEQPKQKPSSQSPTVPPKGRDLELKVRAISKGTGLDPPLLEKSPSSPSEKSTPGIVALKSVPQKPPLSDFRASLRRREIPDEKSKTQEPEFKSVFGKLRRTQTKNYVAPDELKDNILRGKAALSITGGPNKTPRVDEFKESILKQKEAMKAGGGSIRRTAAEDKRSTEAPPRPIPEAIAKRSALHRSDSTLSTISKTSGAVASSKPFESRLAPPSSRTGESPTGSGRCSPTKQPITPQERSEPPTLPKPSMSPQHIQETPSNFSKPMPLLGLAGASSNGKLASRLNPALAGLLARGPPSEAKQPSNVYTSVSTLHSEETVSAPLTHMTKLRARGPKRRLPQRSSAQSVESPPQIDSTSPPTTQRSSPIKSAMTFEERLESLNISKQRQAQAPGHPLGLRESSLGTTGEIRSSELSKENPADSNLELLPATTYSELEQPIKPLSKPPSLSVDAAPEEKPTPPSKPLLKYSESDDIQRKTSSPPSTVRKSSSNNVEKASPPSNQLFSRPINTELKSQPSRETISPHIGKRVVSPPVPPKPSAVNAIQISRPNVTSPISPFPQTPEAAQTFADFFDSAPSAKSKVDIDPIAILSSKQHPPPKTKTLKRQIWEVTNDGKRKDLPANQGYILYEECMYLCVHTYENANGSKATETHLWCGDDVSEASIEDAQLFARRLARENNSKLEVLRQGKEAATFIQGLGGILITRRGSSSRADSSALYMLCGRRHLGQITFDEVDLSTRSLCSGYPYIISATFGKLYLWKGRGSTADELGCARLIGMDLGLTGEIEEVIEGEEPSSFFEAFPDSAGVRTTYPSADHWRLKPNNESYCCRLFRIDHGLGQGFGATFWNRRGNNSPVARPNDTVQEIEPFCQRDLDPEHMYILDAFFEIYV